jgi:hypothetical protein
LAHGKALSGGFFDLTLSIIFIGTSVFSTSVIMSAIGAERQTRPWDHRPFPAA